MEDSNSFTLGNKEYSNQELLLIGREYYPKKFWIKRGIGLGLILIGILCIVPLPFLFYFDPSSFPGGEIILLYYKIGFSISAATCLIPGIVVTAISFIPEKDITYIEYAKRYLVKAYNREIKNNEYRKIDQLKKYKKLLDAGVISQEEFDNKKKEYLE